MTEHNYPNVIESIILAIIFFLTLLLFKVIIGFFFDNIYFESVITYFLASSLTCLFIKQKYEINILYLIRKKNNSQNWTFYLFALLGSVCTMQLSHYDPLVFILEDNLPLDISELTSLAKPDVYVFIKAVIIAPVFEEFLFRGVILNALLKKWNPRNAIILSALLFAIPHFDNLLGPFLYGLFIGWIYYKCNNFVLCIISHLVVNLFAFFMRLLIHSNPQILNYVMESPNWGLSNNMFVNITILVILVLVLLLSIKVISSKLK
ncbi:CPBP family intramembrane metalloprotease [Bacteroidales bacterium OttesenSCG-928-M06]|nr:CPBP family intramembrane metalloprotease [Bacteroidales bacterium OttesenSCG-928-M06]